MKKKLAFGIACLAAVTASIVLVRAHEVRDWVSPSIIEYVVLWPAFVIEFAFLIMSIFQSREGGKSILITQALIASLSVLLVAYYWLNH